VDADRIAIRPETAAICAALGVDPLRLIASGSLLVGVPPDSARRVLDALASDGVPAAVVATMRRPARGAVWLRKGRREPLVLPERDEIARLFEGDG
jgi:hydrogenase expression/formation protein HypE